MSQQQEDLPFLVDALYCEEEHWEEESEVVSDDSIEEEEEEEEEESYYSNSIINPKPSLLIEQDLIWEDEELSSLLSREEKNQLYENFDTNPYLIGARSEAVDWILKVIAHYSFSVLTAALAVNYLDRFLISFEFQREKPWMIQLVSVACLSLAAKVEETHVPLLLDFQVEEARYVFEAKTIQRMEILVLSRLQWKMNPVTPLSFLDFITRRLGFKKNLLCWEFLKRCESLILSILSECKFMEFLPSVMATATMLHVINSVEPCIGVEYHNQLLGILGIEKDKVEECYKLIQESTRSNKRKFRSMPGSPNGVMDVSFSSDCTSNDSWAAAEAASVSSSPEPPLSKKSRTQNHHIQSLINNETGDSLSIPR